MAHRSLSVNPNEQEEPGWCVDASDAGANERRTTTAGRAIACYAGKGYVGAGGTPCKRRNRSRLGRRKKPFNGHPAPVRALDEQGAATLKSAASCARPAAHQAA
jgi:hypothetical protein